MNTAQRDLSNCSVRINDDVSPERAAICIEHVVHRRYSIIGIHDDWKCNFTRPTFISRTVCPFQNLENVISADESNVGLKPFEILDGIAQRHKIIRPGRVVLNGIELQNERTPFMHLIPIELYNFMIDNSTAIKTGGRIS